MKRLIANLLDRLPGHWSLTILDQLRRWRHPKVRRDFQFQQRIFHQVGAPTRVLQGPFNGLQYLSRGYFGHVLPKVLGTYEMELNSAIEEIIALEPDLMVDIGAAEGYYAVGLTMRHPRGRMVCYEMYGPARSLIAELAQRNNVADRVTILGIGTPESINAQLATAQLAAVMCDIEGGEDQLLDPLHIPDLKRAILLVEVHEGYVPGLLQRLQSRFGESHELRIIHSRPRTPADLPPPISLTPEELVAATYERSGPTFWLFGLPRQRS